MTALRVLGWWTVASVWAVLAYLVVREWLGRNADRDFARRNPIVSSPRFDGRGELDRHGRRDPSPTPRGRALDRDRSEAI